MPKGNRNLLIKYIKNIRTAIGFALVLSSSFVLASAESCIEVLVTAKSAYISTLNQGFARGELQRITILENPEGNQIGLQVNKTRVRYNNLRAEPLVVNDGNISAQTMMFYHKNGIAPAGAKALVVLFHGVGADISHSGAMMPVMNYLAGPKTAKKKGSTARIHEKHIDLGVVALDGPGNGYGPPLDKTDTLDKTLDLFYLEMKKIKSFAPELPLIVFARSSSTGIIVAMNKKYPGLLDGMILMSPVTSEPSALAEADKGLEEDIHEAAQKIAQGLKADFIINQPVLEWDSKIYRSMRWHEDRAALGNIPTFVLVGDKDKQTPAKVHDFYIQQLSQIADGRGQFLKVEGAGHDVVSTIPKYRGDVETEEKAIGTYHQIYDFIHDIIASYPSN